MTLREVLLATGQHRFWQRLADEHVDEGVAMPMRGADEAYVSLRLGEMYLARSRKLWRKYHPLLNGLLDHRGNRHQVIADASRFPPFATDQLDRVAVLKHRLAGPVPYAGDDLTLAVALLSVPGADAAQALLATLTDLAALPALATGLDSALKVARAVEQGVDRLLALDQVQLQLGILDTWAAGEGFRAGFYVGIAADENAIDGDRLWVQDGRLRHGEDPVTARAYGAHDYMVVQVEASEHRTGWPLLGDLAPFDTEFKTHPRRQ